MRAIETHGILIVGHGSRRAEANRDVREAARKIGEQSGFSLVEAAFLEIEHPNIAEAFKRLVERGACIVTVHPYFLSPGRHTRGDLPREVRDVARCYPGVSYKITEPLSAHPLVIKAAVERIREAEASGVLPVKVLRTRRRRAYPAISDKSLPDRSQTDKAIPGTVYLMGAGPGDPLLLTLRAHQVLRTCEVIVYDYLADPEVLNLAPAGAERIYAGKVGHGRHTSQEEINCMLIRQARAGRRVVRLKGGDPFLFGRGGEEAEALYWAGIPFEVIPGISSALAVPAYAGIPLTHRELSSSVAILTGASAGDVDDVSTSLAGMWRADTIVILMGTANLRLIADDLMACGKDAETPVAIIRWGSYETQQTLTGTLQSIANDAERARLGSPAVIVVGEVVRLSERLNWFEKGIAGYRNLPIGTDYDQVCVRNTNGDGYTGN